MEPIHYRWLSENLAVCRLSPKAPVPEWLPKKGFSSVTRTAEELSLVCVESAVPDGVQVERGWMVLSVLGPLPFEAVGILRQIASPLAEAGIPIIAIGTFDTDYVMVKRTRREAADRALAGAGLVKLSD